MPESPEKPTEEHSTPMGKSATFVITREMFDQVPLHRSRYILLYIAMLLWFVATRVMIYIMAPEAAETVEESTKPLVESTQPVADTVLTTAETVEAYVGPSETVKVASLILLAILYLTFLYNFVKTMRILGWPLWWIVPTVLVSSIPFLGVLPMSITDRRIADQWDKADDEHTRYREHVYEETFENEEGEND